MTAFVPDLSTPAQRQTYRYLARRFAEVGLEPNARFGQNFLVDYNLLELLARSAQLEPRDVVLEIGTGTGALTGLVAPQVAAVVTVEIDRHLHQLAREELEHQPNVELLHQDALRNKNQMDPRVLDAVRRHLSAGPERRLKLVANLPYNIATPVIGNLLLAEPVPASMTVTIQKELADRLMARPSTRDYGALAVWVQSLCDVELVRILPPSVFWPRPAVHSAIIHIVHRPDRRAAIENIAAFRDFVRSMFLYRRKYLRGVLVQTMKGRLDKPVVDQILAELDLGSEARAEELAIPTIQALYERFQRALAPPTES
jgi:16S rRNA (adenine1518-N6/adenine1519-N6)-dimethyltransferase